MANPERVRRTFPPSEQSIGEARRFVRDALAAWELGDLVDLAVLAVSELVTNVVVHAGTPAEVRLHLGDLCLRVEVQDSHADRTLPMTWDSPPDDAEGGRGLLISAALAPAWGVAYTRTSKTVWLDFPLVDGEAHEPTSAPARREETWSGGEPVVAGLNPDAFNRLGVDDYLMLAVERARDSVSADAAYLLLASDFTNDFEVRAVSGLDSRLVGSRVDSGGPGMPDPRNPHLPILLPDLSSARVPLLDGTALGCLVAVPVNVGGRVAGVLAVASERRSGFGDDQAALLQRTADVIASAVDRARLRSAERERRGWLSFLAEAGDLLAATLDQRMTLAVTAQIVVPQLARWCAIYLDDERQHPVLHQVWHEDERLNAHLRGLLEDWTPDPSHVSGGEALGDDPLVAGELVVLPLVARGQHLGVLLLGRDKGAPLGGEMLLVAESMARRSALAIDNARAHGELRRVGLTLQESLLPQSVSPPQGTDVGVVYEAAGASSEVGGDFYDLFPVDGGRWCFVVGDVCGTGAQAAAVTGLARHTIRALALAGLPVGEILERLNTAILVEGERGRFLTAVCGLVQPLPSGAALVSLVCAGHPPPFLVGADGTARQVGRPQSILGVLDVVGYAAEDLVLGRGDLLVTVTDGVLERRNGKRMLAEEGLLAELELVADLGAQAVAERIRQLVLGYAPTPHQDDMAILAVRVGI